MLSFVAGCRTQTESDRPIGINHISIHLRQFSVVVQPLLGHLSDEQRRLGNFLLCHEQPRIGDADIKVSSEDRILAAAFGAA